MRNPLPTWIVGVALATSFSTSSAQTLAAPLSGTLKKLADTGTIALGVRENQVPFAYVDDNQKVIGFTVDICKALVDSLKADAGIKALQVELKPVTAQTRLALLGNGTIDLDCASVSNNAERQKQVSFSNTFFLTATAFAAKKSSNLKSIADLAGKTVVAVPGTNHMVILNEMNQKQNLNMRIVSAKDQPEAFLMLSTGRAAALVSDDVLLASVIASAKNPEDYLISPDILTPPAPYGLVMRRDDPQFKAAVDKALTAYLTSPAAKANYDKWFVHPIPPRGLRMNFPMGAALKKAYAKPTDSIDLTAY
ncbi:transporter substrate-binding domain-containing protein [Variovorax sp. J22G21]|uniref:transporter substrate-binding domain-containing protein n=1 Tax=Variovorax fucosicus TaxID=3053517 RepID=UPI002577743C|nr:MULTISPECIES: transporter substrate-binding domain-containing protein [unclassified Variovorax]MDM0040699.1 transporter substrate-binding domain-containing protein [Variovorax sp. J22R193]MDM0058817.1 transporter substrate-binding domain-containing protein [Variovorax sp. J22G47]MDM0062072.1 transporter substrate-binding domain-containing protein [Variovorax sp. J22G21]